MSSSLFGGGDLEEDRSLFSFSESVRAIAMKEGEGAISRRRCNGENEMISHRKSRAWILG